MYFLPEINSESIWQLYIFKMFVGEGPKTPPLEHKINTFCASFPVLLSQ